LVGYTANLRLPRYLDEREALVDRMAAFLVDHPRFENEGLGVTAVRARALHERFTAARSATKEGKKEASGLSSERKAARAQLKKRLTAVVGELKLLLAGDDARWHLFGLTPPAERRAALKAKRASVAAEAGNATAGTEARRSSNGAPASKAAVLSA
jgi:hypothetical protein